MIEMIAAVIVLLFIIGAATSIVESIIEGLKQILLILLVIIAVIGAVVLQIYLISRWGLAVIKVYAVIVAIVLIVSAIYKRISK